MQKLLLFCFFILMGAGASFFVPNHPTQAQSVTVSAQVLEQVSFIRRADQVTVSTNSPQGVGVSTEIGYFSDPKSISIKETSFVVVSARL